MLRRKDGFADTWAEVLSSVMIATWNVNSLRVRLPQVCAWLDDHTPDVLCLQETKVPDDLFPVGDLAAHDYQVLYHGQSAYNGVAILAREPLTAPRKGLPAVEDAQARVLAATWRDLRIVTVYVPNGKAVGTDAYRYKLDWLSHLRDYIGEEMTAHPNLLVLGDYNIAPADRDVYDPVALTGSILCSPAERDALSRLQETGLVDVYRRLHPQEPGYTWWDYRAAMFRRNLGLRIDLILVSPQLALRCRASDVDRTLRAAERPSDHAPVWVEVEDN